MANIGSRQRISGQCLFEERGMTVMDSDRRLCCLTLNSTLRFAAMSSFSQTMEDTTSPTIASDSVLAANRSTPMFKSILVINEDEDGEKAETEGEGDGDGALCTG